MKKILLVLIDGMRKDYIDQEDSPFLFSLLEKGMVVEELIKEGAFCERSEVYTGENSEVTGNYAAFTCNPLHSPYRKLRKLGKVRNLTDFIGYSLPRSIGGKTGSVIYKIHKKFRRYLQNSILCTDGFSMNDIPSHLLDQFSLTEDRLVADNPNAFTCGTIFNSMQRQGLSWCNYFDDLRVSENKLSRDQRLEKIIEEFSQPHSLFLFADSEIDAIGHVKGTSKENRKDVVNKVDGIMKRLYDKFLEANEDGIIIFFSPHGMMDVERLFDPESTLNNFIRENKIRIPSDVVYFIDSTMVRIWGPKASLFIPLFQSSLWSSYGIYVSPSIAQKYHIKTQGEIIWWARPGVCNFQDFFRRYSPPKGMHGYFMDVPEMNGFAIVVGKDIVPRKKQSDYLKNLRPTIEVLLNISTKETRNRAWLH